MPHIKKLVMHGFKSFARETEIPFDKSMNCVVGANGSGKSARGDASILLASGETKPIKEIVEESLKKAEKIINSFNGFVDSDNRERITENWCRWSVCRSAPTVAAEPDCKT